MILLILQNKSLIWEAISIFGAASLIAGVPIFFITVSQNQPLTETMEEGINYPSKRNKNDTENLSEL